MIMLKHGRIRQTAVVILCCLLLSCSLRSGKPKAGFADLLISSNAGQILVYARITNCFTEEMEAAILAGVPTVFTFLFDLYEERRYRRDKKIAAVVVQHTIKYDNVKKTFLVSSTEAGEPATFQTLESAKGAMAELNGLAVAPASLISRDGSYYLKMKAKLDRVRLPLRMEYLRFFVSLWDFETEWHKQQIKL